MKTNFMRKAILFAVFLFCFFRSDSSNFMSGEITAQHLEENNYAVMLILYGNFDDVLLKNEIPLDVRDYSENFIFSFYAHYNPLISDILIQDYSNNVGIYVFTDTISFPGLGKYTISYKYNNQNTEIQNLSFASTEAITLKTIITNDSIDNSTPYFLTPPIFFAKQNKPCIYHPLPYDPNGDSLHCSVGIPILNKMQEVEIYKFQSSDSACLFWIDSITGSIHCNPKTSGNFVLSILVEEFRKGIKIGEIIRYMQIFVMPDTSNTEVKTNFNTISANIQGYPYIEIPANYLYQLTINAINTNSNKKVYITSYGEPFQLSQNVATFSTTTYMKAKNNITGSFSWKPSAFMERNNPYCVVFRISDNYFSYDYTILFKIIKTASSADNNVFAIGNIYPNPLSTNLFLPISLDKETKISVNIFDLLGNPVWSMPEAFFDSGKHLISTSINLPNGQYFAKIFKNGNVFKTQKIIVVK